jgi:hypothetical protein
VAGRTGPRRRSTGASATRFAASRFVRFDTGSSRLAVLASHVVVIASGSGGTSSETASASITGVSSTAVVSRFRVIVVTDAKTTHRPNSAANFPPALRASRAAITLNKPACAVSSASTRTVARNNRIGQILRMMSSASLVGSSPVPTQIPPATSRMIAIQSSAPSLGVFCTGRF